MRRRCSARAGKKQELIRRYFKGNPPDPTVFDGTGSFAEYRSALEGQSLFSSDTAVVIQNPFFLKRALKKDDEKPCAAFFAGLRELAPDIFLVITLDGKPDKRTKAVKGLLDFASLIECDYLKAEDGAQHMEEYLYDRGKRLLPDARAYLEDVLSQWSEISAPFLETECDKIILVCGDEANVTKALLEDSLTDYMDQGIFSFFDRLLARDAKAVRERAAGLYRSGGHPEKCGLSVGAVPAHQDAEGNGPRPDPAGGKICPAGDSERLADEASGGAGPAGDGKGSRGFPAGPV